MSKDHGNGATRAAAKEEESVTLPLADVALLQEAAAEVKVLRARLATCERDFSRERERSAELSEQAQGLIGDLASIQAQLTTAIAPTREAAEVESILAGHRRIITLQPYRFDTKQGPKSCPRGIVMQVPEKEFASDSLMRFPRLKDYDTHANEVAKTAKRDAMPVDHASRNLEAVHARVADVMRLREQQRDDMARRLTNPDYISSQIPR